MMMTKNKKKNKLPKTPEPRLSPDERLCGEIWGTKCVKWVSGPDWSHGKHGLNKKNIRDALVNLMDTDPIILGSLARHIHPVVRQMVAENADTPEMALDRLAEDKDVFVRRAVVNNPSASLFAIHKLVNDNDALIRLHAMLVLDVSTS